MVLKNTLFNVNQDDLAFILKQIQIAEAESAAVYGGAAAADALRAIIGPNAAILPFGLRHVDGTNNNLVASAPSTPNALTGVNNGTSVGAADQLLPRLAPPDFRNIASGDSITLPGGGPTLNNNDYGSFITGGPKSVVDQDPRTISNLIVDMSVKNPAAVEAWFNNPLTADKFAVDHPLDPLNPALGSFTPVRPGVVPNSTQLVVTDLDLAHIPNVSPDIGLSPQFNGWMTFFGQFFDHGLDLITKGGNGTIYVPLTSDDLLYDKGLDGVVGVNIATGINDDGWGHDGVFGTVDDRPNFMALTRSTPAINPVTHLPTETVNTTTPWVDQNQTYTSVASHQVFLREYGLNTSGSVDTHGHVAHAVSTGKMLDGATGGIANWADTKAQAISMLGLKLSDVDVLDVPLLVTDAYGRFIAGAGGYAQVAAAMTIKDALGMPIAVVNYAIEGTATGLDIHGPLPLPPLSQFDPALLPPGATFSTAVLTTGHPFLADIAHHAAPGLVDHDHDPATPKIQLVADNNLLDYNGDGVINATDLINIPDGTDTTVGVFHYGVVTDANGNGGIDLDDLRDVNLDGVINGADLVADDRNPLTYDSEMLNAHFITGDGRGNENIGLTTAHTIFHSEHNRLADANMQTILDFAKAPGTAVEQAEHLAFLNEWLLTPVASVNAATTTASLVWDGERIFQSAKFVTEMEYQHLVFEEFARKVQPAVNPFVFTNSADVDPAITAEFAHVVYRFGHSMLTDTVSRLDNSMTSNDISLFDAFLNPQAFNASGANAAESAGNIIRGMSRQAGNEIDEFVVNDLRNRLVGLPLDLAALNIARGRAEGVPSLNNARDTFFHDTNDPSLKAYISWVDYAEHLKNPLSIVNFIAAYGTHSSITSALTLDDKRAAAEHIVLGDAGAPADRLDFLNSTGAWANNATNGHTITGLNDVDLWIGGLAEAKFEFGGMLGSTFNYVFERQMEHLQDGDRFYYISRVQGLNLLNQLEGNTFSALVQRNTTLGDETSSHLPGKLFDTVDATYELNAAKQFNNGIHGIGSDPVAANPVEQLLRPPLTRHAPGVDLNGDGAADGGYLKFLGGEHVVLGGTAGNDTLLSDKGIDTLWGDAGDDYLNAGSESDQVFGGDGDDIIFDPFGADFLRGNDGNDVIAGGQGFKTMFGGAGNDFFAVGIDVAEIFAGPGNDFLLGGSDRDILSGNEGDDWIEGGEGFDDISGENSQLFFNSTIIGNDILNGQGNDTDYDAESGDDIMFEGAGIQRNNGMDGFDWAIHKGDLVAANSDLGIPVLGFPTLPDLIVRDRFDSVEGLSGWKLNDTLTGASKLILGENFDNRLLQEGVDRIHGLQTIVGGVASADPRAVIFGVRAFDGSEIILGGDGSDTMTGNLGNDIMDGDAWLNVRILIHANKDGTGPVIGTAESLTSKIYASIDAAGNPVGAPLLGGKTLQEAMLGRDLNNSNVDFTSTSLPHNPGLNPGQLEMVREILYDTTPANDVDTAVFTGLSTDYTITTDALGRITVVDSVAGRDGTDQLLHFEQMRFSDTTIIVNTPPVVANPLANQTFSEQAAVSFAVPANTFSDVQTAAAALVLSATLTGGAALPSWLVFNPATKTFSGSPPDNVAASFAITVTATDAGGLSTTSAFALNIAPFNDGASALTITGTPSDGEILTANLGPDPDGAGALPATLQWLRDGSVIAGQSASTYLVTAADNGHVLSVNAVYTDGQGFHENVTSAPTAPVNSVGIVATAGPGVITLNGTGGADTLTGNALNNIINGLGGNDIINGLAGADTLDGGTGNDTISGGTGVDTIIGGAGNDTLIGDGGNDLFSYVMGAGGFGNDTISDFDSDPRRGGQDHLNLTIPGVITPADFNAWFASHVTIATNGAGGTLVTILGEGTINLTGVAPNTVTRADFNNVPTGLSLSNYYLTDKQAGMVVGDVVVHDADANDTHTFYINDNRFEIVDGDLLAPGEQLVLKLKDGVALGGSVSGVDLVINVFDAAGAASINNPYSFHLDVDHYGYGSGANNGNNDIYGTSGNDMIDGLAGNDRIYAVDGNDRIIGGAGNDMAGGGNGDDVFIATAGDGDDSYNGGAGVDTYDLSVTTAAANVNLTTGIATSAQTGSDHLWSIENVIGSQGENDIVGNSSANVISGLGGNDAIHGAGGADRIDGGNGNDWVEGGDGNDVLIGGAGNDTLYGNAGNDVLNGGTGNDLYGTLSGNDTIVLQAGFGNDAVNMFDADAVGGQDMIDITAFGITAADFAARVVVTDLGVDALVTIDGDLNQTIKLGGVANHLTVTQSDFVLLTG